MRPPKLFMIERTFYDAPYSLHVAERPSEGKIAVYPAPLLELIDEGMWAGAVGPLLQLTAADCRALMDELWKAGIRPSEPISGEGERTALKEHIKDLQRVTFTLLDAGKQIT